MSDVKLFADYTSVFNVVFDTDISAEELNQDLRAVQDCTYQWKMSFNPDPTKQAEQVIFSTKASKVEHPAIYFYGSEAEKVRHHKHIHLILDETLNVAEHIKEAIIKASRGIGIIRFLSKYVHRDILDQMYKLYVRPHLDYIDVVYHNQNSSLMSGLESIQYAAALAVSGTWQGTNTDKLFEELGWESLAQFVLIFPLIRLCLFYKIMNNSTPECTRSYLPTFKQNPYDLRRPSVFAEEQTNTNRYSNSFYLYCIKAWNNLDPTLRNLPNISQLKKALQQLIRPKRSISLE